MRDELFALGSWLIYHNESEGYGSSLVRRDKKAR
jgi:hypothetical protein